MGAWDDFSKKYNMTGRDWAEWKRTKGVYEGGGSFTCLKCGKTVLLTPLLTFLLAKGKLKRVCQDCEG